MGAADEVSASEVEPVGICDVVTNRSVVDV